MPQLKMYLCGKLISVYDLDYSDMKTICEKENYQRGIAESMYNENIRNINIVKEQPLFFVEVFSDFN